MKETLEIILLTLFVNITASIVAMVIGSFFAILLYKYRFPCKSLVLLLNRTLMALPPVVLGLVMFLAFSRSGPLGFLDLLFTVPILILTQIILLIPIITGHVYNYIESNRNLLYSLKLLGCNRVQIIHTSILEMKKGLIFIFFIGFSRAVSEVGAVMIVGGNIAGETRMMTTAISMYISMGERETAIALGATLLAITFFVQLFLRKLEEEEIHENL